MTCIFSLLLCVCGGDYTVSRSVTIESELPIRLLVLKAGMGVLNEQMASEWGAGTGLNGGWFERIRAAGGAGLHSTLSIDGEPASLHGISARAAWRLIGFIVWDAPGSIERVTDLKFRGRSVRIVDAISNGRVRVRVTVGPPLGDPMVKCAVLELTADERNNLAAMHRGSLGTGTRIALSCSAVIDLPGDRCRLIRRIARRAADREAGPELSSRVRSLATEGRRVVLAGRAGFSEIVERFLNEVCR